jgi:lysophospholipase L1-like esterase
MRNTRAAVAGFAAAALGAGTACGQTGEPACGGPIASQAGAARGEAERPQSDWSQLGRYREENLALPPATPASPRIVFLGDSITESWDLPHSAPLGEVINRGISGQTTPQMLLRFCQDVISLKPAVVHIMAGTNDLAENAGPTSLAAIEDNLASMVDLAQTHHVRVVLASVPPALDFGWRHGLQPGPKILALNEWIRSYARHNGLVCADYHAALADERQGFRSTLSDDGVHPNKAGYRVMRPLARRAIKEALLAAPSGARPVSPAAERTR